MAVQIKGHCGTCHRTRPLPDGATCGDCQRGERAEPVPLACWTVWLMGMVVFGYLVRGAMIEFQRGLPWNQ